MMSPCRFLKSVLKNFYERLRPKTGTRFIPYPPHKVSSHVISQGKERYGFNLGLFLLSKYFFLLNHKFAEKNTWKVSHRFEDCCPMTNRNNTLVYSLSLFHH